MKNCVLRILLFIPVLFIAQSKNRIDCENVIYQLVRSTDLGKQLDLKYSIEESSNDSITIKVYRESDVSEDSNNKSITETVVSWLLYVTKNEKLYDITKDPDKPTKLDFKFNTSDYNYLKCYGKRQKNINCTDYYNDMQKKQICFYEKKDIKQAYEILLNEGNFKYLKKTIPKKSSLYILNKDGLVSIKYIIGKNKINIELIYQGGITTIELYFKSKGIERIITYDAD